MEQDPLQLYKRMQAIEFREAKETVIKRRVFTTLQQATKDEGRKHYQLVLAYKVFKGIMLSAMQSDQFASRLRKVYVRILLRTHFQAIRKYWHEGQTEREERIVMVEELRKRGTLRFFREIVGIKRKKETKLKQKLEKQLKGQTFDNLRIKNNPVREISPHAPRSSTQIDFARNLDESRRSGQSIYSAYDMSSTRRKLVAVKQAPKLPVLLSVQEKPENDSQVIRETQRQSHHTSTSKIDAISPRNQEVTNNKLINLAEALTPLPKQIPPPIVPNALQQQKQENTYFSTYRNQILQILSIVKLTEYVTLTQIVNESSTGAIKTDAHLPERGLISQSQRIIQKIVSMQ